MSTVLAVPFPRSTSSIGRQWIGAHVAAQVICLATAGAAYGLATLIGATDPVASAALVNVAYGLAIVTEVVYAASMAALRGLVLRQVLPAFPMLLWIVAVVGYIMAFHLLLGVTAAPQAPAARAAPQLTFAMWMLGGMFASVSGLVMGLVVGTVEALVLRRVAQGAVFWAFMTGVAWSAGIAVMVAVGGMMTLLPGLSATTMMVIGGVTKIAIGAVMATVTLVAVRQLQPR